MNINALSATNISVSSTSNMNMIDMSMLSKSLDSAEQSGTLMTQMMDSMMELSVNPSVGSNIDLRL